MATFGISYCRIYPFDGGFYDLEYSIIKPTWRIPQLVEHKSIVNGKKHYIKIAEDKMKFEIILNVWKFTPNESTWYWRLQRLRNTICQFMPHVDYGEKIKNIDGATDADFYVKIVRPFYLSNEPPNFKDKILVVLESTEGVKMPLAITQYLVDEAGNFIVDESGDKIVVENK